MINWILEGYNIGDKVFIVNKKELEESEEFYVYGEVIRVNERILKVAIPFGDRSRILYFKRRRVCATISGYYMVCKTMEEYKGIVMQNREMEEMINYISKNLNNLSFEMLKSIKDMIAINELKKKVEYMESEPNLLD